MKKLKTNLALAGIRTYGQRINQFLNAQYYHIQDWIFVAGVIIFIILAIAL